MVENPPALEPLGNQADTQPEPPVRAVASPQEMAMVPADSQAVFNTTPDSALHWEKEALVLAPQVFANEFRSRLEGYEAQRVFREQEAWHAIQP
jgi:hypothetical protein